MHWLSADWPLGEGGRAPPPTNLVLGVTQLHNSSYRFGNEPARMLCAAAASRRVGVVQNALDGYSDLALRQAQLSGEFTGLAGQRLTLRSLICGSILDWRIGCGSGWQD